MNFVIQIGPLSIPAAPLLWLLGFWIFSETTERMAKKADLDVKKIINLIYLSGLIGVIGARLGYFFQFPAVFLANPLSFISPRPYLLSIEGGALFGGLAVLILAQKWQIPLLKLLDTLAPGLAFWFAAIGLAWHAGGDYIGSPTNLIWGMDYLGSIRHPVNLYWSVGFGFTGFYAMTTWQETRSAGDLSLGVGLLGSLAALLHSSFLSNPSNQGVSSEQVIIFIGLLFFAVIIFLRNRKSQ